MPIGAPILKNGLSLVVADVLAFAVSLVKHHPRRVTAALATLLVGGTGATFAVANLAPDASALPVRTIIEVVQPLPTSADARTSSTKRC